jgi:ABC-type Zn uptake system ZnuABC Zn-binding protein ZnuA
MAQQGMATQTDGQDPTPASRLDAQFEALQARLEALDRRIEQRLAEIRLKQDEDLMLLKAMSCQLRGRVGRVERRNGRGA